MAKISTIYICYSPGKSVKFADPEVSVKHVQIVDTTKAICHSGGKDSTLLPGHSQRLIF